MTKLFVHLGYNASDLAYRNYIPRQFS